MHKIFKTLGIIAILVLLMLATASSTAGVTQNVLTAKQLVELHDQDYQIKLWGSLDSPRREYVEIPVDEPFQISGHVYADIYKNGEYLYTARFDGCDVNIFVKKIIADHEIGVAGCIPHTNHSGYFSYTDRIKTMHFIRDYEDINRLGLYNVSMSAQVMRELEDGSFTYVPGLEPAHFTPIFISAFELEPTPTPPPVVRLTPRPTPTPISIPVATPTPPVVLPISPEYLYLIPIALFLILLPFIFYIRGKRKKPATTSPEKPSLSPEQKVKEEQITPQPQISESIFITIERAIYDPCKRDFIERALPRMKEWINRYDPGAYWFALSIQNNTDRAIEEWGVELETSSALKVEKAIIEGMEYKIELRETHPEPYKNTYVIGVPKEYGIVIPKGGAQRVYFKLHTEKPKTTYEISGVFKSKITGDVPIRAKEFKYLCDAGVSSKAVKAELKKTFPEKDAARLALSFKTIQELDRMSNQEAKTGEYLDKLSVLKNRTEGFSDKFTKHLEEFSRFMKEEQLEYLDDTYKEKVKRFCTNLVDVWISEFLKG